MQGRCHGAMEVRGSYWLSPLRSSLLSQRKSDASSLVGLIAKALWFEDVPIGLVPSWWLAGKFRCAYWRICINGTCFKSFDLDHSEFTLCFLLWASM